jgi:hypothetical protein
MTPAAIEDWLRFLRPLAAAVRNPPTAADAKARAGALAFALSVPTAALSERLQREACRRFAFWPSVEEISALVAEDWRAQAHSRAIANAGGAPLLAPPRDPVDALAPEARAAIAAAFRARYAEEVIAPARQREAAGPKVARPSGHLSDGALLEYYRKLAASGGPAAGAARLRVAQIEARLAEAVA